MISVGENFSHYEIVATLGRGGMGEVYLAHDRNLDRKVALKFISNVSGDHRERSRRFTREAKAASALNHPNILTIYEIGEVDGAPYIASEFIEGRSLRHTLSVRKPLDLDRALDIAVQVLSALSTAHAAGIIHRDIKPENIMLRQDGVVKVLDFGLAKLTRPVQAASGSESLTREIDDTSTPGMVVGTAQYMSPEQARGKPVDARTDIWSAGVVLYEMIAGKPPFGGETSSDLLASILKTEPESPALHRPDVTHDLEFILKKALGKDPEDRYQVAKDFLLDIKLVRGSVSSTGDGSGTYSDGGRDTKMASARFTQGLSLGGKRKWFAAAGLMAIGAIVGGYLWLGGSRGTPAGGTLSATQVTSWKSELTDNDSSRARLSPDGRMVAYVASRDGKKGIWLKQIGGGEPFTRKLDNEAEETSPLWSPDGQSIAFLSERAGQKGIWQMPAFGGSPVLLAPIENRSQGLVHWAKDGSRIYFEMKQNLYALEVATRQIAKITNFDEAVFIDRGFSVSPDEKRIAFADRRDGRRDIWIASMGGQDATRVVDDAPNDSNPVWHPDGKRIIYNSDRDGVQQVFAVGTDRREPAQLTSGDSDSRVSDIAADGTRVLYTSRKDDSDIWSVSIDTARESQRTSDVGLEFWPSVSADGSLAFQSVDRPSIGNRQLRSALEIRRARDGQDVRIADEGFAIKFNPDGSLVAFLKREEQGNTLWVASGGGGDARPLTGPGVFFGGHTQLPFNRDQAQDYHWAFDGGSLVYCAVREARSNIFRVGLSGGEEQISKNDNNKLLLSCPTLMPDGSTIAWLGRSTEEPAKPSWTAWTNLGGADRQLFRSDAEVGIVGASENNRSVVVKILEGTGAAPSTPVNVRLVEIDLTAGSLRELNLVRNTYFYNIVLTPDRRSVAVVTRENGTDALQVIPVARGTARTLVTSADPRVFLAGIAFAPDGKTLYYGRQANWQIISILGNFK